MPLYIGRGGDDGADNRGRNRGDDEDKRNGIGQPNT